MKYTKTKGEQRKTVPTNSCQSLNDFSLGPKIRNLVKLEMNLRFNCKGSWQVSMVGLSKVYTYMLIQRLSVKTMNYVLSKGAQSIYHEGFSP